MTRDEIQALAYKAKIKPMLVDGKWGFTNMEVFVDLVSKEEREQCARVCDEIAQRDETGYGIAEDCAVAIRARNNVQQEPQSKE